MAKRVVKFKKMMRRRFRVVERIIRIWFGWDISSSHDYANYRDYVEHQRKKTSDPMRIERWLGVEWDEKLSGFRDVFSWHSVLLKDVNSAICLGARTGQEVAALRERGIDAIGIDLVAFPPYTIAGDFHQLDLGDGSTDLVFSNVFDHALHPRRFVAEIERVLAVGGHAILHLHIGKDVDAFSETIVYSPVRVEAMFCVSAVVSSRSITTSFDSMNWEIVVQKQNSLQD